jgi:hypothetical protein
MIFTGYFHPFSHGSLFSIKGSFFVTERGGQGVELPSAQERKTDPSSN